jgi:hypothetical protein
MSSWGAVENMQIMLAPGGVRWYLPDWRGGFTVGGASVDGDNYAWSGELAYDLSLDAIFRPGGSSGQGLGFDMDISVNDPVGNYLRFYEGDVEYRFDRAGGTIYVRNASVDLDTDGSLMLLFPDNQVASHDPARVEQISIAGQPVGEVQFRDFNTYLSIRARGL